MEYTVGMELAYPVSTGRSPSRWVKSNLKRTTKTLGELESGVKFKLETGRLMNGSYDRVLDPSDPKSAQKIEKDNKQYKEYVQRREERLRLSKGVDEIRIGNFEGLTTGQMRRIANAIDEVLEERRRE